MLLVSTLHIVTLVWYIKCLMSSWCSVWDTADALFCTTSRQIFVKVNDEFRGHYKIINWVIFQLAWESFIIFPIIFVKSAFKVLQGNRDLKNPARSRSCVSVVIVFKNLQKLRNFMMIRNVDTLLSSRPATSVWNISWHREVKSTSVLPFCQTSKLFSLYSDLKTCCSNRAKVVITHFMGKHF